MAVPEQTPYIEHTGNGVTTNFALKFQCESKDHLIVLVDEIEPPIATWSLTGGNVVFTTAPAAGKKITLQRNTPFNRNAEYQSFNNSFRPQTVNIDFDRIWWKLQELGVADWLMKLYVDRLHQQQEQKINDLKGYVDDRDDELRAYLLEEIRKQGVALDQLDDYYNYLMQRLAQIAVDKGWDASFVVDASGKTQQEINDARVVVVSSIADLQALPDRQRKEGLRYLVKGYHAGSDVGGGEFYWSSTDATAHDGVLVFSAHGTSNGRFVRLTKGAVSPSDAGCVVGESNSFDALTRLFHAAIDKGITVRPDTLGETYEFSGDLKFVYPGKRLYVDGRGLQLNSSDGCFDVRGSIDLLGPILTNPASTGEYSIRVASTDGIQVGDLLAIHNPTDYSFSSHRPQYRSGEFVRVKSIGANILAFNSALNDNYPSGITNIYKINTADFKATDFHVNAEGRHSSMRLSFLADFKLIDCSARGGYMRGLMPDRCSVGYILGGEYICDAPAGTGSTPGSGSALQYGINYYCCEDVEVRGAYCFGTRHPIASGGDTTEANIVTRRCNAYECILESSTPNVHGPDFHGNAEDCHYYNCQSNQAVGLAGKNVSWTGGTIGALPGSTLRPLSWHELVGGVIKYAGIRKAVVPPSILAFGQINSASNANIDHDFSIIIDDIDLVYSGNTGGTLGPLTCVNSKATLTSWDVSLTRIRHTGRSGPFSALFSTTDDVENKDFSRLIARDVQGWGDITTSVGLPVSVSVPPDTELDLPSFFVDTVIGLQSGEWSSNIAVPIKTQLRVPKIRLYFVTQNIATASGTYVWVNCMVQAVTRTSVTLRLTTGSGGLVVTNAVSMPVTIEIVP